MQNVIDEDTEFQSNWDFKKLSLQKVPGRIASNMAYGLEWLLWWDRDSFGPRSPLEM